MHVRLGLGQPLEHRAGALLDRVRQPAGADDPEDIAQAPLHGLLALHLHEGPRRPEGAPPHGLSRERVALQRQRAQGGAQVVQRQPGVEQRPQDHVAADAARTVEVGGARHDVRLIMAASRPAPKPLSMLTTAMPLEQALSMASSAASPPKWAP